MARLLYQRDSVSFMLNAIRRHQRLCRKNKNGNTFALAVQPFSEALKDKYKLQEHAALGREDAYDDVQLADADLDNIIRNTFETCETYMRKHPSELAVKRVFPDGTFSDIVRLPYADEPNVADGIASRIESLGAGHELYPCSAEIRTATAAVRNAIQIHKECIRQEKAAEAEVEIEKTNIIRAYEVNYLDARKQLDAQGAERLFPQLSSRVKDKTDGETADNSAEAAG